MSDTDIDTDTAPLLVELLVEELPPKALMNLGQAFAQGVMTALKNQQLLISDKITPFASPRRLGVLLAGVRSQAPTQKQRIKLMPTTVGLDAQGLPTTALLKRLATIGVDVSQPQTLLVNLHRETQGQGKVETLFYDQTCQGATLAEGLQIALDTTLTNLPIPKMMRYQLHQDCEQPGWTSVSFVRPAHGLMALHGSNVIPVRALGLQSDRITQGHRFEAQSPCLRIDHADLYETVLLEQGAVIASFDKRRALIQQQLQAAAQRVGEGIQVLQDEALLDEVTALVERPHVVLCQFEPQFLAVPQACLILTMKANQKYFPLLQANGDLTHSFLVVSNITPADPSQVILGNERVVRPRLADAQFFFHQDRKKTLLEHAEGLHKVVYHNKLGTQAERTERLTQIAIAIARLLPDASPMLLADIRTASMLAKADLLTDMVGEFPELQGIMGEHYAEHEGHRTSVCQALADHYKPRFSGDSLPRNRVGVVLALADKLETLVGLFGMGQIPTGDRDPYSLRRHALGVVRLLIEERLELELSALLALVVAAFGERIQDPTPTLMTFIMERLAVNLQSQGYTPQEVEGVLALAPQRLASIPDRLVALRHFAQLSASQSLASANKRVKNILRKNGITPEQAVPIQPERLQTPAERAVYEQMTLQRPQAEALLAQGDYTGQLQLAAQLRAVVDAFFDHVMIMVDDPELRAQRLTLLMGLEWHMNQVADISKLALG